MGHESYLLHAELTSDILYVKVEHINNGKKYEAEFPPTNRPFNTPAVLAALVAKEFEVVEGPGGLSVTTHHGVVVLYVPLISDMWRKVGTLSEYDTLVQKYSLLVWEWGIIYNASYPRTVLVTDWNRGVRIMIRDFYPHGDNGATLHLGTVIFTKDTDDAESKGKFCHRYVDHLLKPCCGTNANAGNLALYVRKK